MQLNIEKHGSIFNMFVPTLPTEELIEKTGEGEAATYDVNKPWKNYFEQQQSNMQLALSDEGFWIPSVSSDPASVTPSTTGGQLAQVAASFGTQGGINAGTFVFDPYEVNGATPPARNGQVKVMLLDGAFHAIVNS